MTRMIIAAAASVLMSTAAFAQTAPAASTNAATSAVPVPGNNSGIDSTMPAGAASTVVTTTDAPSVANGQSASAVPVPGNTSGIESAMPAGAASTVVTTGDAVPVPAPTASPVPGSKSGETALPAN